MLLSDAFPKNKSIVSALKRELNITTVEQALALPDSEILRLPKVGKMFLHRLRKLGETIKVDPIVFRPKRKDYVIIFTNEVPIADTMGYIRALEYYCTYLEYNQSKQQS